MQFNNKLLSLLLLWHRRRDMATNYGIIFCLINIIICKHSCCRYGFQALRTISRYPTIPTIPTHKVRVNDTILLLRRMFDFFKSGQTPVTAAVATGETAPRYCTHRHKRLLYSLILQDPIRCIHNTPI